VGSGAVILRSRQERTPCGGLAAPLAWVRTGTLAGSHIAGLMNAGALPSETATWNRRYRNNFTQAAISEGMS
jgi:hypothetical protein